MTEKIRRIKDGAKSFTGASGRRYLVHPTLTAEAFQKLEEFRIEIECGNDAAALIKLFASVVTALQKNDIYTASVAAYNALNIAERIKDERPPAFMLALTLFVRPEGADLTQWDEAEAAEWIADWNAAGYAVDDLFSLAYACQTRLDFAFTRNFRDISDQPSESEKSGQKEAESPKNQQTEA